MLTFGTLEEARAARGLRLVVMRGVPSPWSESAKGCFDVKGIDYLAVRQAPVDAEIRAWTGHHNAPVALYDDEPARAGWAEILALAERLKPDIRLVPADEEQRIEMFGLSHEILDEGGLAWCARLLLIHAGIESNGERGFPLRAAHYLAQKYGYASAHMEAARARVLSVLRRLAARLVDGRLYCVGNHLTALDLHLATVVGLFVPLSEALCPMRPELRRAFESWGEDVLSAVAPQLLSHRDFVYRQHLVLPLHL